MNYTEKVSMVPARGRHAKSWNVVHFYVILYWQTLWNY